MTRDISYYLNEPGEYRNQPVEFGNPKQKSELKDRFEVEDAMSKLVDFINLKESEVLKYNFHPITKAILTHYIITYIHPFIDGNGRVSRAVEALILHHYGRYEPYLFPVTAKFYYKERTKYFNLLRLVDRKGDPYPFINFAIDGLQKNLIEIKNHILDQITRTLILDYAHQLRRQKRLLKRQTTLLETMFFLGTMKSDEFWRHPAIKAIYSNFSDSTRKRDISKLLELDLAKYIESTFPKSQKVIEISVNWDALSFVTIKLDAIPHRE
jgi:Fic family protein